MAVSPADYQAAAAGFIDSNGRQPIQRAQASFQWTGSWLTVTLAVDPAGLEGLTPSLRQQLLQYLGDKRLAGYDLEITGPIYLPIDLGLDFSAAPGFQSSVVLQTLLSVLSNGVLPGGAKGFFHPDNFTFGQRRVCRQNLCRRDGRVRGPIGADHSSRALAHSSTGRTRRARISRKGSWRSDRTRSPAWTTTAIFQRTGSLPSSRKEVAHEFF